MKSRNLALPYKWLPVIDEDLCTGCGQCVEACAPKCLYIVDGVATLLCADACPSDEHCVSACPERAIGMQWIPTRGNRSLGKWKLTKPI